MRPLGARRLKVAALAICDQLAAMTDNHEAGAEHARLGRQHFTRGARG